MTCCRKAQYHQKHGNVHCRSKSLFISVAMTQFGKHSCICIVESPPCSFVGKVTISTGQVQYKAYKNTRSCNHANKTSYYGYLCCRFHIFSSLLFFKPGSHDRALTHISYNDTQATKPFRYLPSNHSIIASAPYHA
jgi:hypothetical protein